MAIDAFQFDLLVVSQTSISVQSGTKMERNVVARPYSCLVYRKASSLLQTVNVHFSRGANEISRSG